MSARAKAWATRRRIYGPRGHASSYSRRAGSECRHCERMRAALIKLHVDEVLTEGQAAKMTGLDRVDVRRRADDIAHQESTT